jgi:hypothetical protein
VTEIEATRKVRVTNSGTEPFTDRFDGIPIVIDPGERRELSLDEAAHVFGWHEGIKPEAMLQHVSKRQGWNTKEFLEVDKDSGKTKAQAKFDAIKVEPVRYKMVEERDDDAAERPIPADRNGHDREDDEERQPVDEPKAPRAGRFKRPSATRRED